MKFSQDFDIKNKQKKPLWKYPVSLAPKIVKVTTSAWELCSYIFFFMYRDSSINKF